MNNYELMKDNKEVVRCKNCHYGFKSERHFGEGTVYFCNHMTESSSYRMQNPDDFCWMGFDSHKHNSDMMKNGVVHCKDCYYCHCETDGQWDTYWCDMFLCSAVVMGCGFCEYGEPKEEDK